MPIRIMSGPEKHDLESRAVSLLATTVVVALGVLFCVFLSVAFSDDPKKPILLTAAAVSGTVFLLWLLRESPKRPGRSSGLRRLLRRRRGRGIIPYRPKRRKPAVRIVSYGTNTPPTVDQLRDLAEGLHTWVPTDVPDHQRRSPDQGDSDRPVTR